MLPSPRRSRGLLIVRDLWVCAAVLSRLPMHPNRIPLLTYEWPFVPRVNFRCSSQNLSRRFAQTSNATIARLRCVAHWRLCPLRLYTHTGLVSRWRVHLRVFTCVCSQFRILESYERHLERKIKETYGRCLQHTREATLKAWEFVCAYLPFDYSLRYFSSRVLLLSFDRLIFIDFNFPLNQWRIS